MCCRHIQKQKRTTAVSPGMGTSVYSRVLKRWGFWEKVLEVAAAGWGGRERERERERERDRFIISTLCKWYSSRTPSTTIEKQKLE